MATEIHVQGPAIISIGSPLLDATHIFGNQALDTPGEIGITEDGAEISIQYHDEPVIADTGGPHCPVDLQDMGQTATVRLRLVIYDKTLLQGVRSRAGQSGDGDLAEIGSLVAANGFGQRLIVNGADEIFRFYQTYLRGSSSTKVGTRRTIWTLEFFAWANIGTATDAGGVPLYDHLAT